MNRFCLCSLVVGLVLAACGGGAASSSASSGSTRPPVAALTLAPSNASFSGSNGQQVSVSVTGATGSLTFVVADPTIARVIPSGANSFTVTPIAGGTTTINVTDAVGSTGNFSVSTFVCTPPSPALDWVYPAYGSSNVSASTPNVWFGIYLTGNPVEATISDYYPYLIGNDGSTIQGQNLVQSSSTPPAGATPPSPGYTYTYYTSAIGLKTGMNYKVQLVDNREQCLPPHVYGTFST